MAHHGSNPLDGFNSEELKKMFEGGDQFKKSMPAEQSERINNLLKAEKVDLGATGKFPDGKLNQTDEGEIMVGITKIEDRVVINFGKPVVWIGFTKVQAKQIAESLLKHAQ